MTEPREPLERIYALAERWEKAAGDNRLVANRSATGIREYYDAQAAKYDFFADELRAQLSAPGAAVDVAGLCHWVQKRGNVQQHQSHDEFHFGFTCPYGVVAAVLRGEPDPRVGDDAQLKPCRVFDEPCGSDTCLRLCTTVQP